ncbi:bifunctional endoribonuclease/protein kinase ire1 [Microbotryomycetes sp. JL201]|nr:bifunctional endoribonuclease/protein kinase ire1 [Microbotryomycetes sp. JL201]
MHDGALLCFTAGVPGVSWSVDFETPVVSIFDVAINPEDGKGEQAQPLLFEHPHPLLVEEDLPFDFRRLQQLPETTYVGRIGNDIFALNRDNFPLVAFAPSFGEASIGGRSKDDDEDNWVDSAPSDSDKDGQLVPSIGVKCRGIDCLLGRHRTRQTIPDHAIEPAPSRPAIDGPTSQEPLVESTAAPNPSTPHFPGRSSVLARLSRPVKQISDGDVSPTLFLLFLAIIGYYYVKRLSTRAEVPTKPAQPFELSHSAQAVVSDPAPKSASNSKQADIANLIDTERPPSRAVTPPSAEVVSAMGLSTARPRSDSLTTSADPSPVIPPSKDLPPLPQANGDDVEFDSDAEGVAEKGAEGTYRKKGRRRRGKKGKHKNVLATAASLAAGEPVANLLSSPTIVAPSPNVRQDEGIMPMSSSADDGLRGLQLTAADLQEEREPEKFDPVPVTGPLVVGGLSVSDTILGYGSHGTVVLRGEFQGRAVAVKRLLKDFVTIATHEVSLLQESDDHPHVIRYFCKEQRETFLYIALELCPASLFDLVDQPSSFRDLLRDFEPKRALKQITSGIRHLHNLKIVHRDIKPQNILVSTSTRGKGVRMLISDFGLCKKLDVDESSFQQTVNHAAGSFGYRAPEVLRGQVDPNDAINLNGSTSQLSNTTNSTGSGNAAADPSLRLTRSIDIFSLGCIFYYVLTGGEHPFGGRYEREMNILQGKFSLESLDGLGEEAIEVQHLISRMVANDPRERPTAEAVLLHPFFWNAQKRLLFICDASDRFEIMERDPPTPTLLTLESQSQNIVGDDWQKALDRTLLDNLGKYRKYDGKSVRDLLRVLRNKKHHYQDLPEPVRRNLGDLPGGFLSYFTTRFPNLLLHVYATVETHLRDEPMFASTFKISEDDHVEVQISRTIAFHLRFTYVQSPLSFDARAWTTFGPTSSLSSYFSITQTMKVLVLGATGFIGFPISTEFVRQGHTIIGVTRSAEKAKMLEANEITPVVADPADPSQWRSVIKYVDCVIDAVGGSALAETSETIRKTVAHEAEQSRPEGPALSFIYCSGTWLHGDVSDPPYGSLSDLSPIDKPNPITEFRKAHEQKVLATKSVSFAPNVIRPSLLYGRSGSITASWFETAKQGHVQIKGSSEARIATCHADDAASMFVLVAEKALVVQGIIFDASNPYPESLKVILERLAKVANAQGPTFIDATNGKFLRLTTHFERAIASSDLLRPTLAKSLLGWQAKRAPMAQDISVYYKAWLASSV